MRSKATNRRSSTAAREDVHGTNLFTGVFGNYLKRSIVNAGLDPDNLPQSDPSKMSFGSGGNAPAKAWRDIWGSGQGIGAVKRSDLRRRTRGAADARICGGEGEGGGAGRVEPVG